MSRRNEAARRPIQSALIKNLATLATLIETFASQGQARDERYSNKLVSGDSTMSSHKTFRIARNVAFSAVVALTFGVAAHAGDAPNEGSVHQTVIGYSDLDLSQDSDVRALYGRLQRASGEVCNQFRNSPDLRTKRQYTACYQDALSRAVDSVGHASVKAMYEDHIRMAGRSGKMQAST
jgi:UrcA family protein